MYKLTRKTAHGEFTIKLFREPTIEEMTNLTHLAFNLTEPKTSSNETDDGAGQTDSLTELVRRNLKLTSSGDQTSNVGIPLGAKPVSHITRGTYVEPETGVYLQMLDYPKSIALAIKELRAIVPFSSMGWAEVLRGNYCEVKFDPKVAMQIMTILNKHEIYARLRLTPDVDEVDGVSSSSQSTAGAGA